MGKKTKENYRITDRENFTLSYNMMKYHISTNVSKHSHAIIS